MYPYVPVTARWWSEWITEATQLLTGYALLSSAKLDDDMIVDTGSRTIEVAPTLNTEQLLGAVLIASVYILRGKRIPDDPQHVATVIPLHKT